MKKGQGSVAIVAILVIFVLVLAGVTFFYRDKLFGPAIVTAFPYSKETIRESNTTIIRESNTTILDDEPDTIVITNPGPNVQNNVYVNNTNMIVNSS